MKISVAYHAQIRLAAGVDQDLVEIPDGGTAVSALRAVSHGAEFTALLFDEQGRLRPVILLVVNDVPVEPDQALQPGDKVAVFSPVAGG